jgi:small GTP-binding protein
MVEQFSFDVFISYSASDRSVVREIAERLRADGLSVWFDEWALKPGEYTLAQIEYGLEHSRVLLLCMSANAFGADWTQLESTTFRFRDPLNQQRRLIPLRLDDAPIKESVARSQYIDWRKRYSESEYEKLLEGCRPSDRSMAEAADDIPDQFLVRSTQLGDKEAHFHAYAFSSNGKHTLSGSENGPLALWETDTGRCLKQLAGHEGYSHSVAWSTDGGVALSGGYDRTVRFWDITEERCICVLKGHTLPTWCVALSADHRFGLSGSMDNTIRLWDSWKGTCIRVLKGHAESVRGISWSSDQLTAISTGDDKTLRVWDVKTGRCLRVLDGHTEWIRSVAWVADHHRAVSGSDDKTVRVWDLERERCMHVLEGHSDWIYEVALSPDGRFALSGSRDRTVRLWDIQTGLCVRVFKNHSSSVLSVAWSANGQSVFSGDERGLVCVYDVSELVSTILPSRASIAASNLTGDQVQYTNAKVLLVGESGVGKTGLSKVLAGEKWQPSDSTVGAWATQWKLPVSTEEGVEKEIWLWDFGGQADQRLIHQLYMDETALAVLVFDGQKEDLFDTLGQWDRDLTRASRKEFVKLLVAGRADAGGLRVSRSEIERFTLERKFRIFLETSAKQNLGCNELKEAILAAINWDEIPCRTTQVLFKQLKEEIIRLKDEGRVLMRFNELRETLQLRLPSKYNRFQNEELRAVLTLLAGPGVVWELAFGSWVLLQPERINAYAQAVIRTLQADEYQRGCLMEERVLKGDLVYESSMSRLSWEEERFVLLAMHQTLVERGLCLRQPTDKGNLLVFPSYYRRERPEQVKFPAVLVSYRFAGFLDDVYATLIVRLHHSEPFGQDQLWRYAADFKTNTGKQLGVKLNRSAPGIGELEVYFEPSVAIEEKIIFSKYVHEHLLQNARDVERLRHYVCHKCGIPVGNREIAMKRLNDWLQNQPQTSSNKPFRFRKKKEQPPSIICVGCEQRIPLWDEMEQCFASPEIQQRVRDMQQESAIELTNQSKERALVGEVISTVALANQISREFNVSDHGIDMEIEFTDDNHEATGTKLYLQLKSGDSYLHKRKKDGTETFTIKDERHVRYWMAQAFPVLLVIRNSEGEVRWMEVREWLRNTSENGKKTVKHIVFEGERFDVMSVRRWRDRCLNV